MKNEEVDFQSFLDELTLLSKKHGLFIRGRHENDWWYAPFLSEKSKEEDELTHVAESLFWDEELGRYSAERNDYWDK